MVLINHQFLDHFIHALNTCDIYPSLYSVLLLHGSVVQCSKVYSDCRMSGHSAAYHRMSDSEEETGVSLIFRVLKVAISLLLLVTALFCTVLSKLTLISMTSHLRSALVEEEPSVAVSLYWQLLFVMMVPQCITFLRTMVQGVCGKRTTTYPWPTVKAGLVVSPYPFNCSILIKSRLTMQQDH